MFDASNRQTCKVRLATTSTPLHALTTLNDPTWIEASRVLAQKCMQAHGALDAQLRTAFERVACRKPKDSELEQLKNAFNKQLQMYSEDAAAANDLLAVGAAPRDEALPAPHHAALAMVCLGILNLDEAITRE